MRMVLIVFLLIAASRAWAQSPGAASEKAYVAARVQAGAVLEEKSKSADAFDTTTPGGRAWSAAYDQAKSNLEAELRRLMGPVPAPKGFSGAGAFSPDALCCGLGEGLLDGLLFRSDSGSVLVTTEGLLQLWLHEHKKLVERRSSGDRSQGRFAVERLLYPGHQRRRGCHDLCAAADPRAGRCQPCRRRACNAMQRLLLLPQYIAAAVVKGGRVYVALVDAALPATAQGAAPIGGCDAVWKGYDRYKAADAAYEAAKESSKAYELLQAASRIETEGGAAVDKCWKSRAPANSKGDAASGLTRRAQDLADALAAG